MCKALTAIAVLLFTLSGGARAAPRVEIEWATDGAGPISNPDVQVQVGDNLVATFYLENTSGAIHGYMIDVTYDATELSLIGSSEFLPLGFWVNLGAGTGNFGLGSGLVYEAVTPPGNSPVAVRFAIGTATFDVISVVDDGQPDIVSGPTTSNSVFDTSRTNVTSTTTFQSGRVTSNLASPPAAIPVLGFWGVSLLGLGLLLAAALQIRRSGRDALS